MASDKGERVIPHEAAIAAVGSFREGEPTIVTAARSVVRDHERDPVDGTTRTFTGRDEGRLANAIGRFDNDSAGVEETRGHLAADVAIQAMAAQRMRHLDTGGRDPVEYDRASLRAVHGDSTGIAAMGKVELGNVASGDFDRIGSAASEWIHQTLRHARVEAWASEPGLGARMASIGGFMPGKAPLSAQADDLGVSGSGTLGKGPATGVDMSQISARRDADRGNGF